MTTLIGRVLSRIRFDRNELSGAFGDIGTVLPLMVGIVAVTGMDGAIVFVVFGVLQVATALIYGIPMPVQPLKAAALIVITQKLSGSVLMGGGLAIGLVMLMLTVTGLVAWIDRYIPKAVVRGVQMGLGIQLAILALGEYIPAASSVGYMLAAAAFVIIVMLKGNRRFPPALIVIMLGVVYGLLFKYQPGIFQVASSMPRPLMSLPRIEDMISGFLLLAIPQIPLSLGNSIYATRQMVADFFPATPVSSKKIALTYSFMNIVSPLLGGVPVCHGSGGMAGHYTFGARTGGSVMICGMLFLAAGLALGGSGGAMMMLFPKPILGVILFFEALALLHLVTDMVSDWANGVVTVVVGITSISLPYGYIVGMTAGTILYYVIKWKRTVSPMTKHVATGLASGRSIGK